MHHLEVSSSRKEVTRDDFNQLFISFVNLKGFTLGSAVVVFVTSGSSTVEDWLVAALLLVVLNWSSTLILHNLSDTRYHIEFNSKNFIVEIGTVVFTHCSLGILRSLKGYGSWPKELAKLISIEAADSELTNFLEKFFKIIVSDLFLIEISYFKSHIWRLENLLFHDLSSFLSCRSSYSQCSISVASLNC